MRNIKESLKKGVVLVVKHPLYPVLFHSANGILYQLGGWNHFIPTAFATWAMTSADAVLKLEDQDRNRMNPYFTAVVCTLGGMILASRGLGLDLIK